jgi:glucose/arabinose dehydrogenase
MPVIKKLLVIVALIGIVPLFAHSEENTLSDSEKKSGWKSLFDGKTTKGWRNYNKKEISNGWQVKDGALTRVDKGAGDIITAEKYEEFELSLEYKISKGGNSGIMFHVIEQAGPPWHSGPEIQIQDNVDGRDPQKAGWLYQLYQPSIDPKTAKPIDATKSVGQWNHVNLIIAKDKCELNMNGIRYWTCKLGSPDWNERLAKSKFAKLEMFAKAGQGFICLQDHGDMVSYRNIKVRTLNSAAPIVDPVDGKKNVSLAPGFPNVKWSGWDEVDEKGKVQPLRPIIITHPGDGTNRVVVAMQQGQVHLIPNNSKAEKSKIFLDISSKVRYIDKENEEGFLGLAFHPDYKKNGEFFAYYTVKHTPHVCVISRFKVSKDNPDQADPAYEEVLLEIQHPFWNHKGGTLAFGPDGFLYCAIGDGGGNESYNNGQNLGSLCGKIIRIDVNKKDTGMKYSIPKDNPFVGQKAAPEIFAYGFRNVWRMAFDKTTGNLWAADVGQNLWEEINIVKKGGNYGWAIREGAHPFGNYESKSAQNLIDPVFEYDHRMGKSITGGFVYRGKKIPELQGHYLYADYISGRVYALNYDHKTNKVLGNYSIPSPMFPIITFGEDEEGEAYFAVVTANGKGIYKLLPGEDATPKVSATNAVVEPSTDFSVKQERFGKLKYMLSRLKK